MTVLEAISRADTLRPNAIPEDIKIEWLHKLDGQMCEDLLIEDVPEPYSAETNDKLLIDSPYDDFYAPYLMAMIDLVNEDTALYANDFTLANDAKGKALRHYRRNNAMPHQHPVKVM